MTQKASRTKSPSRKRTAEVSKKRSAPLRATVAQVRDDTRPAKPAPAQPMQEAWDYQLDVWQRSILFWDTLRQRANNMLAARAREGMEQVDRIDILVELGLGDHHGQAAVEWMFDNLDAEYEVKESGRPRFVRSFGESINIRLPGQHAERPAYRFNFSDQHVIGRTLDVPAVSTCLRFEDRVSTWLFAKSSQAGLDRLLRRHWWRKIAVWLFMKVHMGSDICGVAARETGRTKDGAETLTLGLIGRKEALMTAIVAAETARQLLTGTPVAGVLHSEQAIALGPVVSALRDELPDLVVAL